MWLALLCLWLVGCGPVMLGDEPPPPIVGTGGSAGGAASQGGQAGMIGTSEPDGGTLRRPVVVVHILPTDCGRCFELLAEGAGGTPPYAFAWQDGALQSQRRVCVDAIGAVLSVVARDANDATSDTHTIRLMGMEDAGCPDMPASDAATTAELCLENASFEGTPLPNLGNDGEFDAEPWSTCTNPAVGNTPDVGNQTIAVGTTVPVPSDGDTFIALGEAEQISQPLCSEVPSGSELHFEIDLARIDLGDVPLIEKVFLEVWGGLGVDCSQRQLLWASPALELGWKRFCVTLKPQFYMDQLTFRSNADMTSLSPAYLLVDNLQPVDSCP